MIILRVYWSFKGKAIADLIMKTSRKECRHYEEILMEVSRLNARTPRWEVIVIIAILGLHS